MNIRRWRPLKMQHIKQENAQQMNYPTHKKFNALSDNRNKLGMLSSVWMRLWSRCISESHADFIEN